MVEDEGVALQVSELLGIKTMAELKEWSTIAD